MAWAACPADHPTSETPYEGEPLSLAASDLAQRSITAQTWAARSGTVDAIMARVPAASRPCRSPSSRGRR